MFHFGEIEVWARTTLDELFGVVIEVQSKIEDGPGYWRIINSDTGLIEVPSSGSNSNVRIEFYNVVAS